LLTTTIPNEIADLPIIAVSIPNAERISGFSRSEIFRKLRTGELEARKSGRTTLVTYESLERAVAALPRAAYSPLPEAAAL
jgi:hypothetical protein